MVRRAKRLFWIGFAFLACTLTQIALAGNATQHVLTDSDLQAMTGDTYASGRNLPLGDGRYVTKGSRKGYIYLCHVMNGGGGAQVDGPWIHGDSWDASGKISVQGRVSWNDAAFANTSGSGKRVLSGNGLPTSHATGIFPVQSSDPAFQYDRNPNRIAPQTLLDVLPVNPVYSDEPSCMGGEAGVMLTGVPLFNGFDTGMRDAGAHEVQDSCNGHPQRSGQYHYHNLSACIKDIGEKAVIGYALDGFPITGPEVAPGKYLTTENLDECHGITSEIMEDGRKKVTYHYVMTQDFPYSVSCFRGTPTRTGPSDRGQSGPPDGGVPRGMGEPGRKPPPEALEACSDKDRDSACEFTSPRGDQISGVCLSPPGRLLACVPR